MLTIANNHLVEYLTAIRKWKQLYPISSFNRQNGVKKYNPRVPITSHRQLSQLLSFFRQYRRKNIKIDDKEKPPRKEKMT